LSPPDEVSPLRTFLAGLLNWTGDVRPTEEAIAGRLCIYQTVAHIKAIVHRGEKIVGYRSLEADGIGPWLMVDGGEVRLGFARVRRYEPKKDHDLPRFGYAGYNFIDKKAAYVFEKEPHQALQPTAATGRG
jgi:hypothetical protein